jgi:hypothetical protein
VGTTLQSRSNRRIVMMKKLLATTALACALVAPATSQSALAADAQVCPQPTAMLDAMCNPVIVKTVSVKAEEMPTATLPTTTGCFWRLVPPTPATCLARHWHRSPVIQTVWIDPPPVGSPGGVYGGQLPAVATSGTWATLALLTGGPDGTPAGYGVDTLAAWPSVDETVGRP